MMRKLILLMLLPLLASALQGCDDDIKVKRNKVDSYGEVFLEGGEMLKITTDFTSEHLQQALVESLWEFSYSFPYDDYIIGYRNEDLRESRYVYNFASDGTCVATDVNNGEMHNQTYRVNARQLTITTSTGESTTLGVVALDEHRMVCDESLRGVKTQIYDEASLTRRLVFVSKRK